MARRLSFRAIKMPCSFWRTYFFPLDVHILRAPVHDLIRFSTTLMYLSTIAVRGKSGTMCFLFLIIFSSEQNGNCLAMAQWVLHADLQPQLQHASLNEYVFRFPCRDINIFLTSAGEAWKHGKSTGFWCPPLLLGQSHLASDNDPNWPISMYFPRFNQPVRSCGKPNHKPSPTRKHEWYGNESVNIILNMVGLWLAHRWSGPQAAGYPLRPWRSWCLGVNLPQGFWSRWWTRWGTWWLQWRTRRGPWSWRQWLRGGQTVSHMAISYGISMDFLYWEVMIMVVKLMISTTNQENGNFDQQSHSFGGIKPINPNTSLVL